jgi:aldehyde:ferredoxin oxidoreductase
MEYFGFVGKILLCDLTEKRISDIDINREYANMFLGGAGYACRYLFDIIEEKTDPLSPENVIMIMTGPLCGTGAPSTGRFVICSKSPYTGLWGESNCGGFFAPELKSAGYDGIVITGKSETPIYLKIIEKKAVICDASNLWGKGIIETQKILKKEVDEVNSKVLCIGQAGENLVKYSTVASEDRAAGRTGMGAIFGSKNLKGIVVKGSGIKPNIAKPEEFIEARKTTINSILNASATQVFREYGTSVGIMFAHSLGDLPLKYFSQGEWDDIEKISGQTLKEKFLIKNRSCWNCVVGCGRIIKVDQEEYELPECEGPEYETIAGFGALILNSNLAAISKANHLCNDYGIDTISCSGTIGLLYHLFNTNKINVNDVDNLELNWGNSNSLLELIEKIAFREGIGNLLAEGSNAVGEKFRTSIDEIGTINKLEVPYHDMRACYGAALTYGFSPRGACHMTGDIYKIGREGNEIDFSSVGVPKIDMHMNNEKMAEATANLQNYRAVYSSLIMCNFINPPPNNIAELLKFSLGKDFDLEEIKRIGERIFNLKRLFNIKIGLTVNNDYIPKILTTPVKEGGAKGKTPDFDALKKYYYEIRDWNSQTGAPNKGKIVELGLGGLIL